MTRAQLLLICVFTYGVLVLSSSMNDLVFAQLGGPGGQPYPLFVPPNQNWQYQPQGQQPPQTMPQQYPQGQPQGQTWQYQQQGQPQPQGQYPQQGQYQAQRQQPQAPQQQYPQTQAQGRQQVQAFTTKDGLDLRPPYPMPRDPCTVVKLYMDKYESLTKNAFDSYENQTNEAKLKQLWAKPLENLPRDFKLALEKWESAAIICLRFFRHCDRLEWLRFDTVGLCDD